MAEQRFRVDAAQAGERFDKLIVAHCRPEIQLERLMKRDGLSREEAARRINSQMPQAKKLKYADFLIDTSDGFENTRGQVRAVWQELKSANSAALIKSG